VTLKQNLLKIRIFNGRDKQVIHFREEAIYEVTFK